VQGHNLAVDGTMVEANASPRRRVAAEKVKDGVPVSRTAQEYLTELEQTNPVLGAKMISATDPDIRIELRHLRLSLVFIVERLNQYANAGR
jgi:hypothetical protein